MEFNFYQISKIIEIFSKNQALFIGSTIGLDYLTDYDKFILKLNGIDLENIQQLNDIQRMFYFGIYSGMLGGNNAFKKKQDDFEEWLKIEMNRPLSFQKKKALDFIKLRAFNDISGLGNKIVGKLNNKILTANLATQNRLRNDIKKKTIEAFNENKNAQQLASILRELTGDWARDFSRIADYVLQEAYAHGRMEQIKEMYGDDCKVYKQTFPGVCKHCEKNYGSPGEEPIIYTVDELLANGDNVGRSEQLPVVGPAHPFARSILHPVPDNYIWDENLKRFVPTRQTQGVNRKSKVKVTITE